MQWYFYVASGAFLGLAAGSFTNALVWRAAHGGSVAAGRSRCVHCARQLAWYENIPVASFVALRGRCRTCQGRIPWHYPLVELAGAWLFGTLAAVYLSYPDFIWQLLVRDLVFVSIGLIIFVSDALYQIIFPRVVWVGAAFGLIWNVGYGVHPADMAIGALAAGGFFAVQYLVSRGRWIGGGDVRLGVMMGVWLGWPQVLVALFAAYILGAAAGVALLAAGRGKMGSQIAFGTFLVLGTFVSLWAGEAMLQWYRGALSGIY